MARLLPEATVTVVDVEARHLAIARPLLDARIRLVHGRFDPCRAASADLVVVPLAFRGDRTALYRTPPAPLVIVHDWIWHRRGSAGAPVSWFLLKRINLVRGALDVSQAIA
jgi:hypothetical protein